MTDPTAAPPATDILVWVAGRLDKRGSFEDYLLHLAGAARRQGLRLAIAAGPVWDPSLRAALAAERVQMLALADRALRSAWRAAPIIRRLRPRLLHSHFGSPSSSLAPLAKALGVERFVFTDHGSRTVAEPSGGSALLSLKRAMRRLRAAAVDLYLPVSAEVARHLVREIGVPAEKLRPLANGIDLRQYRPATPEQRQALRAEHFGAGEHDVVLLYAGQLTAEKGIEDLLAVQPLLLAALPRLRIAWAGDGPLRPLVEATGGMRVKVLGRRRDVPALLKAADLVVAPSRWMEAFSLILAEAAASGVPAVAARIGGIPEVVEDGVTGLLFTPGNRPELAAALARLIDRDAERRSMAAAAQCRAERLFGLDRMVAATMDHYRALLVPAPSAIPSAIPTATRSDLP